MASKNPLFYLVCAVTSVSVASIVYNLYEANRTKHLPDALNGTSPYDAEVKAALEVALIAGKNLLDALNLPKDMEHKGSTGVDFVTKTDKHNEKIIFNRLKRLFPKHKFIGEETTAETGASTQLTDELTWVIRVIQSLLTKLYKVMFT